MSEITVYSFEDEEGVEHTFTTQSYDEARAFAWRYNAKLIANTFEWKDSELLHDYTKKDDTHE